MRRRSTRAWLDAALACALLLAATAAAGETAAAATASPLLELAPGVHLLRGAFVPGSQPDGNSVVLRGPAGLAVIDTGRTPRTRAA